MAPRLHHDGSVRAFGMGTTYQPPQDCPEAHPASGGTCSGTSTCVYCLDGFFRGQDESSVDDMLACTCGDGAWTCNGGFACF